MGQVGATRVVKKHNREEKEAAGKQIRQRNLQTTSEVGSDNSFGVESCLDPAETEEFEEQILNERNYTNLTNLDVAAIRFEVIDAAAAAIVTTTEIDYGIVAKKISQIITECNVVFEKTRVASSIDTKHRRELLQLKVIGVDGKKDKNSLVHVMK